MWPFWQFGVAAKLRRINVNPLIFYSGFGAVAWLGLHESGVHATLVGVAFAFITSARSLSTETESPLERLEKRLNPWVSFLIVPLFALANAGISLSADSLSGAWGDRVVMGVVLGLVIGKTVGVLSASWLACRFGLGNLPSGTSWSTMFGVSICTGIGFTVSIFVTNLSFVDPELTDSAKLGVLMASFLAGLLGFLFLRFKRLSVTSES